METEKRPIDANRHERVLRRFAQMLEGSGKAEAAEAVNTVIKGLAMEPTMDLTAQTPEGRKLYDPNEPVTISLTRDQWGKITNALKNDADAFYNRSLWVAQTYDDPKWGQEIADGARKESELLDELRSSIEKILLEPWEKRKTEEEY